MSKENCIKWGVKPYLDGSGYEYDLVLREREDGSISIEIGLAGSSVYIRGDDWADLSQQVDTFLAFFKQQIAAAKATPQ